MIDFMREHPYMVKLIESAAEDLGESNENYHDLLRLAGELRYFETVMHELDRSSHYEEMAVLEYNEECHQFHYNLKFKSGEFVNELFSFGWAPVCVVYNYYSLDREYLDMLREIEDSGLSYHDAAKRIYTWFMETK